MKTPEILVIHFFEEDDNYPKDTYSFSLRDTYIPDGCENCGAHRERRDCRLQTIAGRAILERYNILSIP